MVFMFTQSPWLAAIMSVFDRKTRYFELLSVPFKQYGKLQMLGSAFCLRRLIILIMIITRIRNKDNNYKKNNNKKKNNNDNNNKNKNKNKNHNKNKNNNDNDHDNNESCFIEDLIQTYK